MVLQNLDRLFLESTWLLITYGLLKLGVGPYSLPPKTVNICSYLNKMMEKLGPTYSNSEEFLCNV